jgi:hypothetical protein
VLIATVLVTEETLSERVKWKVLTSEKVRERRFIFRETICQV